MDMEDKEYLSPSKQNLLNKNVTVLGCGIAEITSFVAFSKNEWSDSGLIVGISIVGTLIVVILIVIVIKCYKKY